MREFYEELKGFIDNRVEMSLKSLLNTAREKSKKVYSPVKSRYVSSGEAKMELTSDNMELNIWFTRSDIFCGTEIVKEDDTIIINEISYTTSSTDFNHEEGRYTYDKNELKTIRKIVQMYSWSISKSAFFDTDIEDIKNLCNESRYFDCNIKYSSKSMDACIKLYLKNKPLVLIDIAWDPDDDENAEDRLGEITLFKILSELII